LGWDEKEEEPSGGDELNNNPTPGARRRIRGASLTDPKNKRTKTKRQFWVERTGEIYRVVWQPQLDLTLGS